jgi:hypothetical protein
VERFSGVHVNDAYIPGGAEVSVRYDPLILVRMQEGLYEDSNLAQLEQFFTVDAPDNPQEII